MANGRGQSRSRFEVPLARQPRQRRSPKRSAVESNRTLINVAIIVGVTLITTLLFLAISGQIYDTTNASLIAKSPPPTISTFLSPTPQASATVPLATPKPSRANTSPSPPSETATPARTPDDTEIQEAIDKKLGSDDSLAALGITATVNEGRVILVGTSPSDELKARIERLVRAIPGVKQVDNQIAVVMN